MPRMNRHNKLPPLASITGIDGSGKSTVARLAHIGLSEADTNFTGYRSRPPDTSYSWWRGNAFIA